MRRVVVPLAPPAPPPPPAGASQDVADAFGLDLDFDFALPIEQSIPPQAPSMTDERVRLERPDPEVDLAFESSQLKPIEPIIDEAAFEFGDATEVWDGAALDFSAPQDDSIDIDPMLEAELPLPPPVLVPTYAPTAAAPMSSHPPATPSLRPSVDVHARRQQRADRARALIAEGAFADALDLIELLRASSSDGLADQLEAEWARAQYPSQEAPRLLSAEAPVDYESELGGLGATLSVIAQSAVIRTMDLDHRAGYLLSLLDGVSTVEDIIDVASMPREDTLALLVDLKQRGLVQ
jgi:hypothetical protein